MLKYPGIEHFVPVEAMASSRHRNVLCIVGCDRTLFRQCSMTEHGVPGKAVVPGANN